MRFATIIGLGKTTGGNKMAYNRHSKEHDYPTLYAAAIKYHDIPQNANEQRDLVKMFHFYVFQDGKLCKVRNARDDVIFRVAEKIHKKAKEAYDFMIPQLNGGEKHFIKKLGKGIHAPADERIDIEERIAIMLEGCSEKELRPDLRRVADILLPAKPKMPANKTFKY